MTVLQKESARIKPFVWSTKRDPFCQNSHVGMLWIFSLPTGESCIFLVIEWGTQFANWTLKILIRSYSKKYKLPVVIVSCNAADILLCVPEYEIIICITSARKDEKENIACQ